MTDPITLSALGAVALTEGIKFVYGQAGEVLKRWRERKDSKKAAHQLAQTEPVEVELPSIFEGQLTAPHIHFQVVERVTEQLHGLRKDLSDYADGIERVDVTDENLLRMIDALRQLLEAIYQQRLTFKGEQRPTSGPVVKGEIDVDQVAGYAAAIRASVITSGEVSGRLRAERVESGGQAISIDVDKVGE